MRTRFQVAIGSGLLILLFQSSPPQIGQPYVEVGACEGECCSLGSHRALARIAVFANPGAPTTIVDWLAPGDTVHPSEGDLHWKRVGGVLLTRAHKYQVLDDTVVGVLEAGDTIPVLSYSGEGYVNIWHGGQKRLVSTFWDDGRQYPPPRNPPGRVVVRGEALWWLHIRTPHAVDGWIVWSRRLSALEPMCG